MMQLLHSVNYSIHATLPHNYPQRSVKLAQAVNEHSHIIQWGEAFHFPVDSQPQSFRIQQGIFDLHLLQSFFDIVESFAFLYHYRRISLKNEIVGPASELLSGSLPTWRAAFNTRCLSVKLWNFMMTGLSRCAGPGNGPKERWTRSSLIRPAFVVIFK